MTCRADDVPNILTIQGNSPKGDVLLLRLSKMSFSGWKKRRMRICEKNMEGCCVETDSDLSLKLEDVSESLLLTIRQSVTYPEESGSLLAQLG